MKKVLWMLIAASSVCVWPTAAPAQFSVTNLVSDGSVPAVTIDPNLVNAWGISLSPTGPFWIANNGTGTSTLYDGDGVPQPPGNPLVVSIPPADSAPTGTAFYGGNGFVVSEGPKKGPSRFLFVTEDGVISGWSPGVDFTNAITAIDNSASGASYKGCAMAKLGQDDALFATNFAARRVEVYDHKFRLVRTFTDPRVPSDFSPFGIANVRGFLVVTFAKRDPDTGDDIHGPGNGFVDLFRPNGVLVRRLVSHGVLNSPWGIALAPSDAFGKFHGALLIGNFGDGTINAFRFGNGAYLGTLSDENDEPIVIDGLWGLSFGNGVMSDEDDLYFTAGPDDEQHGLFGEIALEQGRDDSVKR